MNKQKVCGISLVISLLAAGVVLLPPASLATDSNTENIEVNVTVGSTISLAVDAGGSKLSLEPALVPAPSPAPAPATGSFTATVTTNNTAGYDLQMHSDSNSANKLVLDANTSYVGDATKYFDPSSGAVGTGAVFKTDANEWGFRLSTYDSNKYAAVPLSATTIDTYGQAAAGGNPHVLTFAAHLADASGLVSGIYKDTVILTAVTK